MASQRQGGGGCLAIIAIVVVIGLVVSAVLSVAALIDPFSWVPPVGQIFGSCTDNPATAVDECARVGTRYPGFWWHVIINFVYALAALGLLVALVGAVPKFRQARSGRFDGDSAVRHYRHARQVLALVATLLFGLAAIPVIAALT
jgi:di/tricarboxylate transporter